MKNPVLKIKKLYAEVQEAFHLIRTTKDKWVAKAAGIELLFTSIEKINKRQDIIVEALAVLKASVANNNKAVNDKLDIIHSIIAEPLRNKDSVRQGDLPEQTKHLENPAFHKNSCQFDGGRLRVGGDQLLPDKVKCSNPTKIKHKRIINKTKI